MNKRFLEVDALRGLAVLCMIVFHTGVILDVVALLTVDYGSGAWLILARCTQFLFLSLVGVSVWLSKKSLQQQLARGYRVFLCGILVSVATFIVFQEDFVRFGILHFIGVAIPIVALFKRVPALALFAGIGAAFLGPVFAILDPWLYSPWDYFPLFPWLTLPLLGLFVGWLFYGKRPKADWESFAPPFSYLLWLGQRALLIYLIHFPILYLGLLSLSALVK